jgi:hypothetical protein
MARHPARERRNAINPAMSISVDDDKAATFQGKPWHRQRPSSPPLPQDCRIGRRCVRPISDVRDFAPAITTSEHIDREDREANFSECENEVDPRAPLHAIPQSLRSRLMVVLIEWAVDEVVAGKCATNPSL